MTLDIWFWLFMALWALFGLGWGFGPEPFRPWAGRGFGALSFVLFVIVGLRIFGSPVK